MSFKIIIKNVQKNLHDYFIYFLTLLLSVSLFYAFNSITTQPAFAKLSATKALLAKQMGIFISILSIVIAIVLAFLIIYANQFLLRRRKKELGIYMLLGMAKGKISRIFVGETFVIGIIALTAGLFLGFIFSQGLSLISLKLFAVDLSNYRMMFSLRAFQKTIICFAIIFILVMCCNAWIISKVKLIDLLMAGRKNENLVVKNKKILLFIFGISLIFIFLTGNLFTKYGIMPNTNIFKPAILFLIFGTGGFYYSMSAVLLSLIQTNKSIYLKGLNVFLLRQIGSKIQSNFLSMTIVCLLLTATICTISTGISIALTMNQKAEDASPYDLTVQAAVSRTKDKDIFKDLKEKGYDLTPYIDEYEQISLYETDLTYQDLFQGQKVNLWKIDKKIPEVLIPIISLSDYNKIMSFQGMKPISLRKDCFLINCNYKGTIKYIQRFLEEDKTISIAGKELQAKQKEPLGETVWMSGVDNNDRGTLIVPDSVTDMLRKADNIFNAKYKKGIDTDEVLYLIAPLASEPLVTGYRYIAKSMMYDMYYGTQAFISFLCSYIGFLFLLICVALLALQQLTETTDNINRYGLLQKLGTDESLIKRTLFKQIVIYFFAPIVVAGIFSILGIREILRIVEGFLNMSVSMNILVTVILFLIVYGGYFLATYYTCKRMVEEKFE
ncbi:ABC transporter permease [Anaerosacchariphilus polymeriproducens]|uniref:ABC transporter permease n=1 Tax=Anaerosacchariphilus polymeriproducens TaxID=1812858 RepID=A0A371AXC1_9FIRM|nr:FtsX-like permease family protein [Anaerosacchariphilus polymeriproducens]RDU24207.1 ABC transporter permease [Anaerosacchariphilus polymeriproducens]